MTCIIVVLVREPLQDLIHRRVNIRSHTNIVQTKDWRILTKMLTKISIIRAHQTRVMIVALENTTMEISTGENLMKKKIEKKLKIISTNQNTIAMNKTNIIRVKIGSLPMKGEIEEDTVHQEIESQEGVLLLEAYLKA